MALSDVLSEIDTLLKQAEQDYPDSWERQATQLTEARCRLLTARMTLELPPFLPEGVFSDNPILQEAAAGNIAFYDDLMAGNPDAEARMAEYGRRLKAEMSPSP